MERTDEYSDVLEAAIRSYTERLRTTREGLEEHSREYYNMIERVLRTPLSPGRREEIRGQIVEQTEHLANLRRNFERRAGDFTAAIQTARTEEDARNIHGLTEELRERRVQLDGELQREMARLREEMDKSEVERARWLARLVDMEDESQQQFEVTAARIRREFYERQNEMNRQARDQGPPISPPPLYLPHRHYRGLDILFDQYVGIEEFLAEHAGCRCGIGIEEMILDFVEGVFESEE